MTKKSAPKKKKKPRLLPESLPDFLNDGIDLEQRLIDIDTAITSKLVKRISRALLIMQDIDPDAPITIILCTGGGSVIAGLKLYDIMIGLKCPITTIAGGMIASMGLPIYLAGDKRYAMPHTRFMQHAANSETDGKLFEMKTDVKEIELLDNMCLKIHADRTKRSYQWWADKTKFVDYWFGYDEAIKLGVVTEENEVDD